jgi:hypothetical protein
MQVRLFISERSGIGVFLILVGLVFAFWSIQPAASALARKVPVNWITLDVGGKFELKAPPGSAYVPRRGIDSSVGRIETPDFTLDFDYGAYSGPLRPSPEARQYQARQVEIDGKAATIVTAFAPGLSADRPYFIGAHFPNLKRSVIGPIRLTMTAWVRAPKNFEAIEAVFASIRFK